MHLAHHIEREAKRLINRHERNMQSAHIEHKRRSKRSASALPKIKTHRPEWWDLDPGFNPYQARARSETIGHSIWAALKAGTYRPRPPVALEIAKPGGGSRQLSVFQVADSAVSRMVFESVLAKNTPRLSGRAYAYRKDLSSQDAIHFIQNEWTGKDRVFVAEYDFSAYFSSLGHAHLERTISDRSLFLTPIEKQVMKSFMTAKSLPKTDYRLESPEATEGIPQGTSISLVLANLAAAELDRRLERIGVGFARYADDTLIWAATYEDICKAVVMLTEQARTMGVTLNRKKSPGISLLLPKTWEQDGEIRTKRSVNFLGHNLGLDHCEISLAAQQRIRERCNTLIYNNLLREPLANNQAPNRLIGHDSDYITLLSQLRRYFYGDLTEAKIARFQKGQIPFRHFSGVMSAYPLIDDSDDLKRLDGWLVGQVHQALYKRRRLLEAQGLLDPYDVPTPHGLTPAQLLQAATIASRSSRRPVDLKLPSVRRIADAMRQAARTHGAGAVGSDPLIGLSNPPRSGSVSSATGSGPF